MYQIVPLLLALALLAPWNGPSDPGDRMAAANAADGLAQDALVYHQAALASVLANPDASGILTDLALPAGWSVSGIAACVRARTVATYVTVPSNLSKPAVAAAMARVWGGYPLAGQTAGSALISPFTGMSVALPCTVPDRSPAILSQAGGRGMRDLIGAGLAIFLSLLGLAFAAPQIQRNSRLLLDAPNAYQLQSFAQAANAYLSVPATFTAVLAATASGNVQISAATLKAAGALDPSFVDANGYGQSHVLIVRQVSPSQLQALAMTCGGTAFPDQSTRHLIELAGGPIKGGGIPAVGVLSTRPAVAIGANGGLKVTLANFAGTACPPAPGHIGAALFLDGSQIIPPYLFSNPVPGAGTAPNTMNTTLYMGGNDIQNADDVYSSTKQRWMSQSVQDAVQGGDGLVVAKPACQNGTPEIYVAPVAFSDNGVGLPLIGVQAWAVDTGKSWTAHLVVITQNAAGSGTVRIRPDPTYGQLIAFAKCT